jgi:hypothetical protein
MNSRTYRVCESSLRWVLNMRAMRRNSPNTHWAKVVEEDGHSGGSYYWTQKQSEIIENEGFEYWLDHTEGPKGYLPRKL